MIENWQLFDPIYTPRAYIDFPMLFTFILSHVSESYFRYMRQPIPDSWTAISIGFQAVGTVATRVSGIEVLFRDIVHCGAAVRIVVSLGSYIEYDRDTHMRIAFRISLKILFPSKGSWDISQMLRNRHVAPRSLPSNL